MKIFISHSSLNKNYGNILVDLLRGLGINEDDIIFTSNIAYGIPVGKNIFTWLKSQITENPFVIYLLSEEYYKSVACLNEMGAAWIIDNEHVAIFTPDFDLKSKEFQNGALDPREIGFFINDEERIFSFVKYLNANFKISSNPVIINQEVKKLLLRIQDIKIDKATEPQEKKVFKPDINIFTHPIKQDDYINIDATTKSKESSNSAYKFVESILLKTLTEEELLLIHYMIETARTTLFIGWQEQNELDNITEWENINNLNSKLSTAYSAVVRRIKLRGFTEVSATTSSGNPKEIKLKDEIEKIFLDLPTMAINILQEKFDENIKPRAQFYIP